MASAPSSVPPRCKAILLCDQVIVHAGPTAGKLSLIGVFGFFAFKQYPVRTRSFSIFVQIVNALGRYDLSVEIRDLQADTVIGRSPPISIEVPDRFATANLVLPVPPVPLAHPGKYDLVVLANGNEIDRQQFTAFPAEATGHEQPDINT